MFSKWRNKGWTIFLHYFFLLNILIKLKIFLFFHPDKNASLVKKKIWPKKIFLHNKVNSIQFLITKFFSVPNAELYLMISGSLGTSVFDSDVYLVGASGGVYALLAAHLANVLLNYNNMEFGIVRLIGIFIIGRYPELTHVPSFCVILQRIKHVL